MFAWINLPSLFAVCTIIARNTTNYDLEVENKSSIYRLRIFSALMFHSTCIYTTVNT